MDNRTIFRNNNTRTVILQSNFGIFEHENRVHARQKRNCRTEKFLKMYQICKLHDVNETNIIVIWIESQLDEIYF